MNNRPVFHSPELQKAFDAVHPLIEGAEAERLMVSEDIASLETYLQSLNLKKDFYYSLGIIIHTPFGNVVPEHEVGSFIEYMVDRPEECLITEEALAIRVWEGNCHLLYEKSSWPKIFRSDSESDSDPYEATEKDPRLEQQKPLNETPWEVRLRLYKHLPAFLEVLGGIYPNVQVTLPGKNA